MEPHTQQIPGRVLSIRTRRVGEVLFSILEIFELSRTQKALAKLVSHSRLQGGWVGRGAGWAQSLREKAAVLDTYRK